MRGSVLRFDWTEIKTATPFHELLWGASSTAHPVSTRHHTQSRRLAYATVRLFEFAILMQITASAVTSWFDLYYLYRPARTLSNCQSRDLSIRNDNSSALLSPEPYITSTINRAIPSNCGRINRISSRLYTTGNRRCVRAGLNCKLSIV